MSSDEDEQKKRSINEMFGDDSDESDTEQIRSGSAGAVTADASGLFGSDSESEDEDTSKSIKKKKKAAPSSPPPAAKRLKPTPESSKKSRKRDEKPSRRAPEPQQRRADSGDEYDSGEEIERTKDDDDFIDKDDDFADVLDEYNDDRQNFDDERPLDEKAERAQSKDDFFDETLKSLKTGRRNKLNMSVQEMEQVTQELLYQMDKAWADDQASIADGKPALEKIKYVDKSLRLMRKLQLQPMLLDFDLLSIVKKWISPLEDGTLPNVGVRTKMLHMVNRMPIYKEHLKRSGFGKVVMALWKHPEETKENKDLCRDMIERWSRSVFNKTLDFSKLAELEAEKAENAPYRRPQRKQPSGSNGSRMESGNDLFRSRQDGNAAKAGADVSERARLPDQLRFDFLHRPQPKVDMGTVAAKKTDPDSRKGRLMKRMQEIAKPGKKGKRAVGLSIEGR